MMNKQHIIYKITNQLTNRFYIGMHTGYPEDGYFGSGKRLKAEIKKYGKENFKKEILEIVPTRKDLELREAQIVDDALLANPLCLNLKNGGEGGGKLWNEEHRRKWIDAGRSTPERMRKINATIAERKRLVPGYAEAIAKKQSSSMLGKQTFLGKKHSEETKQKMRKPKNVGEANSQFGTCWVTNGTPIKIKKEQLDEYLLMGYRRGRKT